MSLKIDKQIRGHLVVLFLSGRIRVTDLPELLSLTSAESSATRVVLDLKGIGVVDREIVPFLVECEKKGIVLENTPAYIVEWITGERE